MAGPRALAILLLWACALPLLLAPPASAWKWKHRKKPHRDHWHPGWQEYFKIKDVNAPKEHGSRLTNKAMYKHLHAKEQARKQVIRDKEKADKKRFDPPKTVTYDAHGRATGGVDRVAAYMAGSAGRYAGDHVIRDGQLPNERMHAESHNVRREDEATAQASRESVIRELGAWWSRKLGGGSRKQRASPYDDESKHYEVGRVDPTDAQQEIGGGDEPLDTDESWARLRARYQRKRDSPLLGIGREDFRAPLSQKCGHFGACAPYGSCNEETGRCMCMPGFRGTFCKDEVFQDCIVVPGLVKVPCGSTASTCACRKQCYENGVGMFNASEGCLVPPYVPKARDVTFEEPQFTKNLVDISTSHVRRYEWRPMYNEGNRSEALTPEMETQMERIENLTVSLPLYFEPFYAGANIDRSKWNEHDKEVHTAIYDLLPLIKKSHHKLYDYDLVDCENKLDVSTCDFNRHRGLYYMAGNETFTHWSRKARPGVGQPKEYAPNDGWQRDRTLVDRPIKPLRAPSACDNHGCWSRGMCVSATADGGNLYCDCFPGFQGDDCSIHAPRCINDCSGYGSCMAGTCNCTTGAYGADCSLPMFQTLPEDPKVAQQAFDEMQAKLAGEGALNVYVYDLPPHLSTEVFSQLDYGLSWSDDTSYAMEVRLWETLLRDVNTRVTHITPGAAFPLEADFFFVPMLQIANGNGVDGMNWEYVERVMEYIKHEFPQVWDKNKGADHIVPFAGNVGACRAFAGNTGHAAIRLSHWGMMRSGLGVNPSQHKTQPTAIAPWMPSFGGDCHRKGTDIVLPAVKDWRQKRYAPMLERLKSGNTTHRIVDNPIFIFGRLEESEAGMEHDYSLGMQQALTKNFADRAFASQADIVAQMQIDNAPGTEKAVRDRFYLLQDKRETLAGAMNDVEGVTGLETEKLHELYASSTFCLTTVRRGWAIELIEIILNDCIPVVLAPGVDLPFSEVIPWEEILVIFNGYAPLERRRKGGSIYNIDQLHQFLTYYTEGDLRRMKTGLNCVWPRLIWDKVFPTFHEALGFQSDGDAYTTFLEVLFRRKQKMHPEVYDEEKIKRPAAWWRVANPKCVG